MIGIQAYELHVPYSSYSESFGCLVCTTTGRVLGPTLPSFELAEAFADWIEQTTDKDPRDRTLDLHQLRRAFLNPCECSNDAPEHGGPIALYRFRDAGDRRDNPEELVTAFCQRCARALHDRIMAGLVDGTPDGDMDITYIDEGSHRWPTVEALSKEAAIRACEQHANRANN